MTDETKVMARIALLVALGLVPALIALVLHADPVGRHRGRRQRGDGDRLRHVDPAPRGGDPPPQATRVRAPQRPSDARRVPRGPVAGAARGPDARPGNGNAQPLGLPAPVRGDDRPDGRLGRSAAFLLVDVEGFKAINTEKGRIEGDAILKRVAGALADATRGTDCVGRLGGDEFGARAARVR